MSFFDSQKKGKYQTWKFSGLVSTWKKFGFIWKNQGLPWNIQELSVLQCSNPKKYQVEPENLYIRVKIDWASISFIVDFYKYDFHKNLKLVSNNSGTLEQGRPFKAHENQKKKSFCILGTELFFS